MLPAERRHVRERPTMSRGSLHRWIVLVMVTVLVASVATWWFTLPRLPNPIRIATAEQGGLYHEVGSILARELKARTGCEVEVVTTPGSVENVRRLSLGQADLAIVQASAVALDQVSVLTPLYPEPMHVLVRHELGMKSLPEFAGGSLAVGRAGSGMHQSAMHLLEQYHIEDEQVLREDRYFVDLEDSDDLDGAIVTTGISNPDLTRLLGTGRFQLLPIEDAGALSVRHPTLKPFTLPRGLYHENPPVPARDLKTVATTAVLAASPAIQPALVEETLGAVYQGDLRAECALFISRQDALNESPVALNPTAHDFLDPYRNLSLLANFVESLVGIKELLFGVVALAYLLWDRVRRLRERENEKQLSVYKERLDVFLDRTAEIERQQMHTRDFEQLERYLDEVTLIKLEALGELSHEDLRGDRMFLIFLTQCANLIRKIQTKMQLYGSDARPDQERSPS